MTPQLRQAHRSGWFDGLLAGFATASVLFAALVMWWA